MGISQMQNRKRHSQQPPASPHERRAMGRGKSMCKEPRAAGKAPAPTANCSDAHSRWSGDSGVSPVRSRVPPTFRLCPSGLSSQPSLHGACVNVCAHLLIPVDFRATHSLLTPPPHPAKRDSGVIMVHKFTGIICDNSEKKH